MIRRCVMFVAGAACVALVILCILFTALIGVLSHGTPDTDAGRP